MPIELHLKQLAYLSASTLISARVFKVGSKMWDVSIKVLKDYISGSDPKDKVS